MLCVYAQSPTFVPNLMHYRTTTTMFSPQKLSHLRQTLAWDSGCGHEYGKSEALRHNWWG